MTCRGRFQTRPLFKTGSKPALFMRAGLEPAPTDAISKSLPKMIISNYNYVVKEFNVSVFLIDLKSPSEYI
jgi:hypothetical protein